MQPEFLNRLNLLHADAGVVLISFDDGETAHLMLTKKCDAQQRAAFFEAGGRYILHQDIQGLLVSTELLSRSRCISNDPRMHPFTDDVLEVFARALDMQKSCTDHDLAQAFYEMLRYAHAKSVDERIADDLSQAVDLLKNWFPMAFLEPHEWLDHRKHMEDLLSELLKRQPHREVPIASMVIHQGEVVGLGFNAVEASANATKHAEMIAIEAASQRLGRWRLNDCTIYSTLEPCPMCLGAIHNAGFEKLVFGAVQTNPKSIRKNLFERMEDLDVPWMSGVEQEECEAVLRQFFEDKR